MHYWLRQLPGGLCTRAAVIASALRKPTSVFTKAEIPSYAPQIMERTGPARQSSPKLFTLSEVSANMLSQRRRGSLSVRVLCQVDFLLLSQTLSLPLRPFTPPFGPQRRPPVWSQAASVYCALPVASPHSVHSERRNLDVPPGFHLSVGAARPLVPFYRLRSSCPHSEREI